MTRKGGRKRKEASEASSSTEPSSSGSAPQAQGQQPRQQIPQQQSSAPQQRGPQQQKSSEDFPALGSGPKPQGPWGRQQQYEPPAGQIPLFQPQQQQQQGTLRQQQQGPPKQQQQGPPRQQQQQGPPKQQQQQQGPPKQQQQQQGPHRQQQQQGPPRQQQQQQGPPRQQQQQQDPPRQQQQQQRQPQQQQQQPTGPQKQQPQQQPQVKQPKPKQAADKPPTEELSKLSLKEEKRKQPAVVVPPTVIVSSQQAQMQAITIPKRKNPNKAGTLGRRIQVYTNMMKIQFGNRFPAKVIHYDVDIVPNLPKYLMRKIFEETKKKLFPKNNPAFDGKKNAFSAGYLPFDEQASTEVVVFNEDGREKNYKVTLKVAQELDLRWLKDVRPGLMETERDQISLTALDIILRNAPALQSTPVGRSFFTPPKGHVMSLGGGMDLWVGLFQSAVLGWRPYLNVDVAHKGFPKPQSVIDLMKTLCGCDGEDQGGRGRGAPTELTPDLIMRNKVEIQKYLKNLKVTVEIPGQSTSRRTQRVNDLVKPPRENTFEHNGKKISVEQYYRLEKKYVIKYPQFPCLWVGPRDKNIHVPPELCTIVSGQATQKKLDEKQTASMIRFAATGTDHRKQKIMDAFNSMRHNQDPTMREFDVSISGEFEKVEARVLDPPDLLYQTDIIRVAKGEWRAKKFTKPVKEIENDGSWTILNLNRNTRDTDLYKLQDYLINTSRDFGMTIGRAATPLVNIQFRGNDTRELFSYFNEQKRKGLKLIIVIVPEMKGPYSKVKQITELSVGVLTQCLKGKTLMKLNAATVGNILLKINAKLNGINHTFELRQSRPKCLQVPCMIVGADVTHPSPDATDIPSIAAVAASHDPNAFKYNVEIRLQPPRQEIIGDLAEIMKIQLTYFYQQTGRKPLKIIFYRDGVSEAQFGQIMHAELMSIRAACRKLEADYKPQITFLVVQKRHHIRLFPTDKRNSDDAHRNFNVQAGTIVDTEITHPSHIDFYLVSHASIQGTARPTKYRCLFDDSQMSEDEIENLTYFLCHMFSRCTRSVSYPTPTYYAHLAAFRARALTQDVSIDMQRLPEEQNKKLSVKAEVLKGTPMFFV